MENSNISWTDHTFNPWIGCTKVSPGCTNCYAETLDRNRYSKTLGSATKAAPVSHWGPGAPRHRTSENYWQQPLRWNRQLAEHNSQHGDNQRAKVFSASLADWLDDEVPIEWLVDFLSLIHATPFLDWLLLSKRPQNWLKRIASAHDHLRPAELLSRLLDRWLDGEFPETVWIGTTVEDQARAEDRLPNLLAIPARVRFLSCEPLLGPVDLVAAGEDLDGAYAPRFPSWVDWVICGGESGPGARPMAGAWVLSLREQCAAANVPFFFKQWGPRGVPPVLDGQLCQHFPA